MIPKVSLLLLTLDRYQMTKYCVENMMAKAGDVDYEILILDNFSSDQRVVKYVRELNMLDNVTLVEQIEKNMGIASGFNNLLNRAKGEHICFLSNDILLGNNWLLDLIHYNNQIDKSGLTSIHCEGEKGVYGPLLNHNDDSFTSVWQPKSTTSGVSLINRSAFESVGAFDESLGVYGREREQYASRLHMLGFHNYYVPGQFSVHLGREVNDESDYKQMKTKALQLSAPVYTSSLIEMKKKNNFKIEL